MELHELRQIQLFDGTGEDQVQALREAGAEVSFDCGDVLFQENHPAEFWWVLLEGRVDLLRHVGREETQLGVMDVPGRWAGGFRAWVHAVGEKPSRSCPVTMKPLASRTTSSPSQSVRGEAPMKTNSQLTTTSSVSPVSRSVSVTASR